MDRWQVYARWSSWSDRPPAIDYVVHHAGGSTPVTVDQRYSGGRWNSLGEYDLAPGQNHRVSLSAVVGERTVADGVRFVPIVGARVVQADAVKIVPNTAYDLAPGQNHRVALSAVVGERTVADGVRFVPIVGARVVQADAVKIVPNTAEDALYVHADQLGTPRKLTDPTGAVVWDASLTPYGLEDSIAGTETLDSRFPGQRADAESGLSYNYFRDYDPTLGRYIQSDPIGLRGGLNTYAYVGGNPVNAIDPRGLEALVFGDETDGKPVGSTKDIVIGVAGVVAPPALMLAGGPAAAGAVCRLIASGVASLAAKGASLLAKKATPYLDDLSRAGAAADRNGLTRAGRALQKHGDRSGSSFPKSSGSAAQRNQQGQKALDDILSQPGSTTKTNNIGGVDIRAPNGQGARFGSSGDFVGFLE